MPRPLIDAKASLIFYPPQLTINTDRKGHFDVTEGSGKFFFNELAESLRLNLTMVPAPDLGFCSKQSTGNWNCTGIIGQLRDKQSDLSFVFDDMTGYDHDMGDFPVTIGKSVGVLDSTMVSLPVIEGKNSFTKMAETFNNLPSHLYIAIIIVYLLSMPLVNWSIRKRKWIPKLGPISLLAVTILQPYLIVKRNRHRLAYLSCLLAGFYSYQVFAGSIQSEMVTMIPPVYVETLQDIITYNRTPLFMGGLTLHTKDFLGSKDPLRQALVKKSFDEGGTLMADDPGGMPALTGKVREGGVALMENRYIAESLGAMTCIGTDYNHTILRKMKLKPLFEPKVAISLWRKDIWKDNPILARRLQVVFDWYLEGGLWVRHEHDIIYLMRDTGLAIYHKAILCMEQMSKTTHNDLVIHLVTLHSVEGFLMLMLMAYAVCVAILVVEKVYQKYFPRTKPKSHRRRRNVFSRPTLTLIHFSVFYPHAISAARHWYLRSTRNH